MATGMLSPHSRPNTPIAAGTTSNAIGTGVGAGAPTSSSGGGTHSSSKQNIPTYEKPMYEKFNIMYKTLLNLKNNRSKYIDSKQVYQIYDLFLNYLYDLKLTRKDEELKGMTLNLPNINDLLIDDICQLLSLCFVTCGLIKFAPATYSSLSAVMKLLTHLQESNVYTEEDLHPIGIRLNEIRDIIMNTSNYDDVHDEEATLKSTHQIEENLLRNKLNKCEVLYQTLQNHFKNIPPDLEPTYHKLIGVRKTLLTYLTDIKEEQQQQGGGGKRNTIQHEKLLIKINQIKQELKSIEAVRDESDGKFYSNQAQFNQDKKQLESLQAIMNGLIDECNNLLEDLVLIHQDNSVNSHNESLEHVIKLLSELAIAKPNSEQPPDLKQLNYKFETLYQQLSELKLTLENLLVTRRWTLRETDLYTYQKSLKTIDEERIRLSTITSKTDPMVQKLFKKYQTLILYLLRRCYSIIYKLLESSEPVSESLSPIHNQLQTVKRCLLELKRVKGLNNLRELYPFQFKLGSLDNLRKDGKFIVNNQIPEGQGTLNALLAECFDILQELKIELEENEEDEYDEEDEEDETQKTKIIQNKQHQQQQHNSNYDRLSNINGGSFTNSKGGSGSNEDDLDISEDEVEIKRNRFQEFNEADYDLESESAFDEDLEELEEEEHESDDDDRLSYVGNDYY
ncbi:uncharacterized protein J8A68_002848 [[Candida] subhashii]|uniref:Uncharacterized protein n=1 Tax=[Candida] subhashii TaxID=561895 RepID=A0A8J5QC36_9ASCO|nr:uncharacterized protein J8A68_002848 [[Candida] subhashii]KAG7663599.1 hypothetical protein J8A68_002848 [[Candida] subhashii]